MRLDNVPVESEVVVNHPLDPEPRFNGRPDGCAIERTRGVHGRNRLILRVDEKTALAMTHDLSHRTATPGDDRCAASHRLDDTETERLIEVDEVQQGRCAPEQRSTLLDSHRADVPHEHVVDSRLDEPFEIAAIQARAGTLTLAQ